jgi:hypothetical protein
MDNGIAIGDESRCPTICAERRVIREILVTPPVEVEGLKERLLDILSSHAYAQEAV